MSLKYLAILPFILFIACSSGEQQPEGDLPSDTLTVTGAWARPAAEDGNSAVYLTFQNGTDRADTLKHVSSTVAEMVQVHESYEQENGLAGMRHVENLVLEPRSALTLEPGEYHIMLMRLTKSLQPGERIELVLEFSRAGKQAIQIPVRDPNS